MEKETKNMFKTINTEEAARRLNKEEKYGRLEQLALKKMEDWYYLKHQYRGGCDFVENECDKKECAERYYTDHKRAMILTMFFDAIRDVSNNPKGEIIIDRWIESKAEEHYKEEIEIFNDEQLSKVYINEIERTNKATKFTYYVPQKDADEKIREHELEYYREKIREVALIIINACNVELMGEDEEDTIVVDLVFGILEDLGRR